MNYVLIGGSFLSLNIASYISQKTGNYLWRRMFPPQDEINYQRILEALREVQNENRIWHDLSEKNDDDFSDIIIIDKK